MAVSLTSAYPVPVSSAAATGLDRVRAVQRGDLPTPGFARLLGFTLTRVERCTAGSLRPCSTP